MAITRTQQARQMLKKGSKKPVVQGGVDNYLGDQPQVVVPRKWQSGPDKPPTELAYITEAEKKLLLKEDIHGSLKEGPNEGPGGVMSLDSFGDIGGGQAGAEVDSGRSEDRAEKTTFSPVKSGSGSYESRIKSPAEIKLDEQKLQNLKRAEETKAKKFTKQAKKQRNFLNQLKKVGLPTQKVLYNIFPNNPQTEFRYISNLKYNNPQAYKQLPQELRNLYEETEDQANEFSSYKDFDKFSFDNFRSLTNFEPTDGMTFAEYAAKYEGKPGLLYSGDVGNLVKIKNPDGTFRYERRLGDDGPGPRTESDLEKRLRELEEQLKNQEAATTSNLPMFRFMNRGGMVEDAPMGGIMDLETTRQMLFIGGVAKSISKGLKSVTRGIKKVAKSPLGKAALLGAIGFGIPGTGFGGLFGRASFGGKAAGLFRGYGLKGSLQNIAAKTGLGMFENVGGNRIFQMKNLGDILGNMSGLKVAGLSGLAGALLANVGKDKDDDFDIEEYYKMAGIDIPENQYRFLAEGGSEDLSKDPNYKGWVKLYEKNPDIAAMNDKHEEYLTFYQREQNKQAEGSREPVAKKTMPLLDLEGQEMDFRQDGGFVPIGRMEKADDVPARLSKNEFVFTAEAVRNAGGGDVDKGAEVMYNTMKNLEAGGEVSEETQGLEGARNMFQTSQRLGEVV